MGSLLGSKEHTTTTTTSANSSTALPLKNRTNTTPAPGPTSRQSTVSSSAGNSSTARASSATLSSALKKKPSAGILTTTTTPTGARATRITSTSTSAATSGASRGNRPVLQRQSAPVPPPKPRPPVLSRRSLNPRDENVGPATAAPSTTTNTNNTTSITRPLMRSTPQPRTSPAPPSTGRPPPTAKMAPSGSGSTLKPTVARNVNSKQPFTPKIASRPANHQTVTLAATTPQPRRRPESALSNTGHGGGNESHTPVAQFLSSNITPRSGSRQSRVDSPNGTPTVERSDSFPDEHLPRRSVVGFPTSPSEGTLGGGVYDAGNGNGVTRPQDPDAKFFYASDAQGQQRQSVVVPTIQAQSQPRPFVAQGGQPQLQAPPPLQQRQSTFFYANGNTVQDIRPSVASLPTSPALATSPAFANAPTLAAPASQDNLMSKFVYANGNRERAPILPGTKTGPTFSPTLAPASVVSAASRAPSTRSTAASTTSYANLQRPSSPTKPTSHVGKPGGSTVGRPPSTTPQLAAPPNLRRTSGGSALSHIHTQQHPHPGHRPGHTRNNSLTIAESPAVARLMSSHSNPSAPSSTVPSSPSLAQFSPSLAPVSLPASTAVGFASLLQAAEDFAEASSQLTTPDDIPQSPSTSHPDKESGGKEKEELSELVASARRERKVQDLQITNASLEAINRTLERQLRKQTAEIRRYKRLSRAGVRVSLVAEEDGTGEGGKKRRKSRIVSDATSVEGGALARAGLDLDDLSEASSLSHSSDESDLSDYNENDSLADSELDDVDASARRRRDEKRLRLDLSKHQQLLVDSQKINMSIKRCLGWTEELIKEGKRALEYQVRVSEVELPRGGRVLAPEEVERRRTLELEGVEDDGKEQEDGDGEGLDYMDVGEGEDDEDGDGDDTIHGIGLGLDNVDGPAEGGGRLWVSGQEAKDRDSGIELPTVERGPGYAGR